MVAELSSVLQGTAEWVVILWNKKRVQKRTDKHFLHNNTLHEVEQEFVSFTSLNQ